VRRLDPRTGHDHVPGIAVRNKSRQQTHSGHAGAQGGAAHVGSKVLVGDFSYCEGLRMPAVGDRSHTQRRPASANLQCTKSRKAEHPAAAGSMGI
jgi:hypothetical protein